ncbi:MAG: hypothetical protein QS748_00650 [Candidatus Endonucleobacter bathymodioli]|uniref:Uncharacterized protein n=1 Tax=Candidatus Endonucleibacter bathymodioli TaxID=539814 RepID=A0AA90NJE8_9GAMM|nr:hypothetical protein [Candidatus Endonucleobacter bathymodioli]
MSCKLFIFLILFSSFTLANNESDQKGYAILVDKKTLSSLENDDVFLNARGDYLESLEELIAVIMSIADSTERETKFCIINSTCYRENMTKICNESIASTSVNEVKCIAGTWMSLPAWIIFLHELTLLELQKKGGVSNCNSILYTRFLKCPRGKIIDKHVAQLEVAIDYLGKKAQRFCYNRKGLAFNFADALKRQDSNGRFKDFLAKSPFENEAYNYYLEALHSIDRPSNSVYNGIHQSSVSDVSDVSDVSAIDDTGYATIKSDFYSSDINSSTSIKKRYFPSDDDFGIGKNSGYSDNNVYQCDREDYLFSVDEESDDDIDSEGGYSGDDEDDDDGIDNESETILKELYKSISNGSVNSKYDKEQDFQQFAAFMQELAAFSKSTELKSKHPRHANPYYKYCWKDEKGKIRKEGNSTAIVYEQKTLDLSKKLSVEEPDFFNTTSYDESVFFLFGDFSTSYHQDIMIDHIDIGMLFDTAGSWFYHILNKAYYSISFFMERCVHYDVVKTTIFQGKDYFKCLDPLDRTCGSRWNISRMLSDPLCLPLNRISANANKYLYSVLNSTIVHPDIYKGAIFPNCISNILLTITNPGFKGRIINRKNICIFKQRAKTYQLALLLLQQSVQEKIVKGKHKVISSGAFYVNGFRIKDFTPKTINDFAVLWDKPMIKHRISGIEVLDVTEEQKETTIRNILTGNIELQEDRMSYFSDKKSCWEPCHDEKRKDLYVWRYCKHEKLLNLDYIHYGSMVCSNIHLSRDPSSDYKTYKMTNFHYLPNIKFYRKKRQLNIPDADTNAWEEEPKPLDDDTDVREEKPSSPYDNADEWKEEPSLSYDDTDVWEVEPSLSYDDTDVWKVEPSSTPEPTLEPIQL